MVIDIVNPINMKEVQQLNGRFATLPRFLSCAYDKAFPFFTTLMKKEMFKWTSKCEEAFAKVIKFLITPLILTPPKEDSSLFLYLSVSKRMMSLLLVQEIDKA